MIIKNTKDIMFEIKTYMLKNNIKQIDLAEKMNILQPTLSSRFLSNNISINTLIEICDALNLNVDINLVEKDDSK